jgi:hypothetical protein
VSHKVIYIYFLNFKSISHAELSKTIYVKSAKNVAKSFGEEWPSIVESILRIYRVAWFSFYDLQSYPSHQVKSKVLMQILLGTFAVRN